MLKQFLLITVILFLLSSTGCISDKHESLNESLVNFANDEAQQPIIFSSAEYYSISFNSIEDFLYDYATFSKGGTLSTPERQENAEGVNLSSLDEIHLPVNLPEEFRVTRIDVKEFTMSIRYYPIPDDYDMSMLWSDFGFDYKYFDFNSTRWTYEDLESWGGGSPLDGVRNQISMGHLREIAEGYFLARDYNNNELLWAHGSNRLILYMPKEVPERYGVTPFSDTEWIPSDFSTEEILSFAETVTINLKCEDNIAAWSAGDFSAVQALLKNNTNEIPLDIGLPSAETTSPHAIILE